jgi:hypothetical protein
LLLILLLGGGGLFLITLLGCGIGGYFLFFGSPIAGTWESPNRKRTLSFGAFGGATGTERMDDFFNPADYTEITTHFRYTLTKGDPMTLELKPTKVDVRHSNPAKQKEMEELGKKIAEKIDPNAFKDLAKDLAKELKDFRLRYEVRVDGDTMTMTMVEPFRGGSETLRRVR